MFLFIELRVIHFVGYSDTGYDVVFMFDGSASNKHFSWMKGFAHNFASQMDIDSGVFRVGAMSFDQGQNLAFHLNENGFQSEVMTAITSKPVNRPGGPSNVAAAFDAIRENMFTSQNGDRPNARDFIILMTDKPKSQDTAAAQAAFRRLQNAGIGVFTVGMELGNTDELDSITTPQLDDFQSLINTERELGELPGILSYVMEAGVSSFISSFFLCMK